MRRTPARVRPNPPALFPTIHAWRLAHDYSQTEAARILALSQTRYSRLERGTRPARGPLAMRLHVQTGVSLAVLIGAV